MYTPSTPVKEPNAHNEINTLIRSLSASWSLQLPIRDSSWSPSSKSVPSLDENVYGRIRYLYFQDREALNYAIDEFRKYASASWVPKPHADPDVLPSRITRSTTNRDAFLKKRVISDEEAEGLREALYNVLKDVADRVQVGRQYDGTDGSTNGASKPLLSPEKIEHSPITKLPKQTTISEFFRAKQVPEFAPLGRKIPARAQHPSSDEYPIEDTELLDLVMPDAPLNVSHKHSGSSEQEYGTPPEDSMVPKALPKSNMPSLAAPIFRKPQLLPAQSKGLKRSCPEVVVPSVPHKVSREKRSSGFSRSHSANEIMPEMPNYDSHINGLAGHVRNTEGTDLVRSFSSISTATIASSTTRPSTGFTTPNTSFHADSMTTSFDSTYEGGDATITSTGMAMLPVGYDILRSTSEPPSSGVAKSKCDEFLMNVDFDDVFTDTEEEKPAYIKADPSRQFETTMRNLKAEQYLQQNLVQNSPFAMAELEGRANLSFRQLYEVERIARACNIPPSAFTSVMEQVHDDYDRLWTALTLIAKSNKSTMPERSSTTAWKKAEGSFDCVALSGALKFSECTDGPLMKFTLNPMKLESSYRLSRKFGGDRFCVISMPGIELNDLPKHLKASHLLARPALVNWLSNKVHSFLGRKWRAFFVKPDTAKKTTTESRRSAKPGFRVFFFAEDGKDFTSGRSTGESDGRKMDHQSMNIARMIDWFMPAKENPQQNCLKLFSRLKLAVSSTKPAIQFRPCEIVRCDDAYAHNPSARRLNLKRSDEKKNHLKPIRVKDDISDNRNFNVMNDGCARISRAAARDITETLGLDTVPSVFQGRVAGAKGIWMVDALDESFSRTSRGYWIEITDSQLKFEGHPTDEYFPDRERVTFEVTKFSKKLSTASLNYQLMPILEDRGVPYEVFKLLLEEDLTAKVGELEVAMDSPLALRKWNQDNNSVVEERLNNKGIEMVGGMPDSLPEKINWFVEHGFQPKACRILKEFLYSAIKDYCTRLENKMNIELGKSTYAFMIADPLAVLEENEVHIGFSSMFRDTKSEWSDNMLHDMDILVSRSPALLPSDVQKVRAVFKPELRIYRDVIVFSSKGACSLAGKLSGGDFDGDRAWICWEPSIVEPFQNAVVPEPIDLTEFGIEKDGLQIKDILHLPDFTDRFLNQAFDFNLRANMLGICTVYHEAMCYHGKSLGDRSAVAIAYLLGLLVDRPKAAIIFDESHWYTYLKQNKLKSSYSKPAYKDKAHANPNRNNLIDKLVFDVAKTVRQDALGKFSKHFQDVGTHDGDLNRLYYLESDGAKQDHALSSVLFDLKRRLNEIYEYWKKNVTTKDDSKEITVRRGSAMSFRALVEKCRADFLSIEPLALEGNPVTKRWKRERVETICFAGSYWELLKASTVYYEWHKAGNFAWYIAGVELGELKATAAGKGSYRIVKEDIFEAFKLDNKVVKRRQEMEYGRIMEEEEDEFEEFDWDDIEV